MSVSFHGTAELVLSFEEGSSVSVGAPVSMAANHQVMDAAAGSLFAGVALHTRRGIVAVQLKGYVELPFSGSAPALGWVEIVADGNGGVKTAVDGLRVLVISVDASAETVGLYL